MGKPENLIGRRFGRLVAIGAAAPVPRGRKMAARWRCVCDCGEVKDVRGEDLRSGNSTSCGCGQREKARSRLLSHGQSNTQVYKVWAQMKQRCTNPNDDKFDLYGGRGIKVCQRWADSFEAFRDDMGPRPRGFSIDRIDGDGNYEPGNCRWATAKVQGENTTRTIWVEHGGQAMTAKAFADLLGVDPKRLYKAMSQRGLDAHTAADYVRSHRRS